jgi:hypothetical protein
MSFKNPLTITVVIPAFMGELIDNFDEAIVQLSGSQGADWNDGAAYLRFIYLHGMLASCLFGVDAPEPREAFALEISKRLDALEETMNPRDASQDH